jgi:hypothetical protein
MSLMVTIYITWQMFRWTDSLARSNAYGTVSTNPNVFGSSWQSNEVVHSGSWKDAYFFLKWYKRL